MKGLTLKNTPVSHHYCEYIHRNTINKVTGQNPQKMGRYCLIERLFGTIFVENYAEMSIRSGPTRSIRQNRQNLPEISNTAAFLDKIRRK